MQKKKSGVEKCLEICAIRGGIVRLMAKTNLNFHFDYLKASLSPFADVKLTVFSKIMRLNIDIYYRALIQSTLLL